MPASAHYPMRRRPTSDRAKLTVESILIAAEAQLVAAPFSDFNTNVVAERAGVSVGSLYQYFRSKEAIIAELRLRAARHLQAALQAAFAEIKAAPPEQIIRRLVRASLAATAENVRLHRLLLGDLCDVGVAPDFETRAALVGLVDDGGAQLRAELHDMATELFGEADGWPVLLGAWGLLRVMTTLALMEDRFDGQEAQLEDDIVAAISQFIAARVSARTPQTEIPV